MSGDVLSAALVGINVAIDAGKALVSAQGAIERAELKLKLADIVSALAEAKLDLGFIQGSAGDHALDGIDRNDDLAEAPADGQAVAFDDVGEGPDTVGPVGEDEGDEEQRSGDEPGQERLELGGGAGSDADHEARKDERPGHEPAPDNDAEGAWRLDDERR